MHAMNRRLLIAAPASSGERAKRQTGALTEASHKQRS